MTLADTWHHELDFAGPAPPVDVANAIDRVHRNGALAATLLYDPAGNLVADGEFIYQFDGWNRLVQVNEPGSITLDPAQGNRITAGTLGLLVTRYTYDGLGRLIAKETPVDVSGVDLQTKDLYYDGVRRIAEAITRPLDAEPPGDEDNDELPDGEGDPLPPAPTHETWTDREYVYGPDYVDSFLGQEAFPQPGSTNTSMFVYMLQDANYNVMALLVGGSGVPPEDLVLEQYTYEPYGELVAAEAVSAPPAGVASPVNRVGHQGLFFGRFDGTSTDPGLSPGAIGLYYNRNRFYSPALGRFIQRDPNATGLLIIANAASHGRRLALGDATPNPQILYLDGVNAYLYLRSSPHDRHDPLGLYTIAGTLTAISLREGTTSIALPPALALIARSLGVLGAAYLASQAAGPLTLGLTGAFGHAAELHLIVTEALIVGDFALANSISSIGEEAARMTQLSARALQILKRGGGRCEFYMAWCLWANSRPSADQGQGWRRGADCAGCYLACKVSEGWPFRICPLGRRRGPRWPTSGQDFKPVWPTVGQY